MQSPDFSFINYQCLVNLDITSYPCNHQQQKNTWHTVTGAFSIRYASYAHQFRSSPPTRGEIHKTQPRPTHRKETRIQSQIRFPTSMLERTYPQKMHETSTTPQMSPNRPHPP